MERKWLIAIVIIAIIIVGGLGWYFFFSPKEQPVPLARVYIDAKNYTTPLIWNFTVVNGTQPTRMESSPHTVTNDETNATNVAFNCTIWRRNETTNQWIEQYDGRRWLVAEHNTASIYTADNITRINAYALANKTGEKALYFYSLTFNDNTIYLELKYIGNDPTVDGQTVFAYVAFDGDGNNTLDGSDKAFNFTNNPSLSTGKNQLKVYTPTGPSSWNSSATEYSWDGNISSSSVPITVVLANNRKDITFAIPFDYIGAKREGSLGFILQAFSHDWVPSKADPTTPAKYTKVSLALAYAALSFEVAAGQTFRFYIRTVFLPQAKGDYSIVINFAAVILQHP
jgi:hypothetical protein